MANMWSHADRRIDHPARLNSSAMLANPGIVPASSLLFMKPQEDGGEGYVQS